MVIGRFDVVDNSHTRPTLAAIIIITIVLLILAIVAF
jgi:hypothetical protein